MYKYFFLFFTFCVVRCESSIIFLSDRKAGQKVIEFQFNQKMKLYFLFSNHIIAPDLRTFTRFSVTSVPKTASTAVRANSIGALRLHMTDGRRGGAFINVCVKKKELKISWFSLNHQLEAKPSSWIFFFSVLIMYKYFFLFSTFCVVRCESCIIFLSDRKAGQKVIEFQFSQKMRLYFLFSNHITVPDLYTCTRFSVTSVPRTASTAVRANSIGALRLHMTDGRRGGAFIDIFVKK